MNTRKLFPVVNDELTLNSVIAMIESGDLKLPVYDPVSLKIQEVLSNNSDDIDTIEKWVLADQVLALEVLRAANSPFYCSISPIRTIRHAIVRLGTRQLRRLIFLVSERMKYRSSYPDLQKLLLSFWRHSSVSALSAQWLSRRLRFTGIEEICFLGGLLHDIGNLIIVQAISEMRDNKMIPASSSPEAIRDLLAAHHCRVGYNFLKRCDISDIYCQIARDHHKMEFPTGDLTLAIVRLAVNGSMEVNDHGSSNFLTALSESPEANLLHVQESILTEFQETLVEHIKMAA